MGIDFLWDEEKTRKLFKTHLLLFFIGGILASIYVLLLPKNTPFREIVLAVPIIFTLTCPVYYFFLPKPGVALRFLIFTLEGQLAATIFMAVTGGFVGITQFAPYMFLLFAVFELGAQAALILGLFSLITFIAVLLWSLLFYPTPNILLEFFYFAGSYLLIVIIEHNLGRELSVQNEARKKLEEVDSLKNQFLLITSHYLRTPLTSIKLFVGSLDGKGFPNQQLNNIKNDVLELEFFFEKLLTIGSFEKGKPKITLMPADLNGLLKNLVTILSSLAAEYGVTISYLPTPIPVCRLDANNLREAFETIIENAILYNKKGGTVKIVLSQIQGSAQIEISDSGIGMDINQLNSLFTTFNRGSFEKALSTTQKGFGLNLYIAKAIFEAHGGKIEVYSIKDQGSTFTITLPIRQ